MGRGVPKAGRRKTYNWYVQKGMQPPPGLKPRLGRPRKDGSRFQPPATPVLALKTTPTRFARASAPINVERRSDAEILQRITERFRVLDSMTTATINGHIRALLVSGPPGLGKTYSIQQKLAAYDPKGERHTIEHGKVRATGVYSLLYEYRHKGNIVVFDDADSIFKDDDSLNLLKAACDTLPIRHLSWRAGGTRGSDSSGNAIPNRFEYQGAVIFVTNLDFNEIIAREGANWEHLEALKSRALYCDLEMRTRRARFVRIKQVAEQSEILATLNEHQRHDVMTFVERHLDTLSEVSLRMVAKLVALRVALPDWRANAEETLCERKHDDESD